MQVRGSLFGLPPMTAAERLDVRDLIDALADAERAGEIGETRVLEIWFRGVKIHAAPGA